MESQNARRHILGAINCIDREIEDKQREKRKLRDILLEMEGNRSGSHRDNHRRRQSSERQRSRDRDHCIRRRDSYRSTGRGSQNLLRSGNRDHREYSERRTLPSRSKNNAPRGETVNENSRETENNNSGRFSTLNSDGSISITINNKSKDLSPYGKYGCCYCGGEHFPHQCAQVTDPIERRAKFQSGKWCLNCGLHKKVEHVQCRQKPPVCEICQSDHLTVLHEFKKEVESPTKST